MIIIPPDTNVLTQEQFDALLKWWRGVEPYRCTFVVGNKRHVWIRFFRDMEKAHNDTREIALREYPEARAFMTESVQGSAEIWNSWRRELGDSWGRRDLPI